MLHFSESTRTGNPQLLQVTGTFGAVTPLRFIKHMTRAAGKLATQSSSFSSSSLDESSGNAGLKSYTVYLDPRMEF